MGSAAKMKILLFVEVESEFGGECYLLSKLYKKRSSAVAARWAHNSEVG